MNYAIKTLRDFVVKRYFSDTHTFYLLVDPNYRVVAWEGPGEHFGLGDLHAGDDLNERLLFLAGLDQEREPFTRLDFVETPSGASAHLHIAYLKSGWGLVFMDASRDHDDLQRQHQKANESVLNSFRQESLLRETQQHQRQLQDRVEQLKQSIRPREEFIEQMAHEVRTPLLAILESAKLAKNAATELGEQSPLRKHLQSVDRGSNYLLTLVDNLLDHSRIEKERLTPNPAVWNLQEILQCLDEIFRPVIEKRDLSLSWWVSASVPEQLFVDGMRLRQLLFNIISNAVKFTHEGTISVSAEWNEDRLSFLIEDTGMGMDKATLERLFQPFQRGAGAGQGQLGAGLGLYVSREISRALGGELRVSSHPAAGTRVTFFIKAANPQPGQPEASNQRDSGTILVRDDDESVFF